MNVVKGIGVGLVVLTCISVYTHGSLFVTIPLAIAGAWVYLIGGLSE